jgi:hypothetical protein
MERCRDGSGTAPQAHRCNGVDEPLRSGCAPDSACSCSLAAATVVHAEATACRDMCGSCSSIDGRQQPVTVEPPLIWATYGTPPRKQQPFLQCLCRCISVEGFIGQL